MGLRLGIGIEHGVYIIYEEMSLSSRAWDGIIIYFFGIELEHECLGSGGDHGVYIIYEEMSLSSRAWDGIIIYFSPVPPPRGTHDTPAL